MPTNKTTTTQNASLPNWLFAFFSITRNLSGFLRRHIWTLIILFYLVLQVTAAHNLPPNQSNFPTNLPSPRRRKQTHSASLPLTKTASQDDKLLFQQMENDIKAEKYEAALKLNTQLRQSHPDDLELKHIALFLKVQCNKLDGIVELNEQLWKGYASAPIADRANVLNDIIASYLDCELTHPNLDKYVTAASKLNIEHADLSHTLTRYMWREKTRAKTAEEQAKYKAAAINYQQKSVALWAKEREKQELENMIIKIINPLLKKVQATINEGLKERRIDIKNCSDDVHRIFEYLQSLLKQQPANLYATQTHENLLAVACIAVPEIAMQYKTTIFTQNKAMTTSQSSENEERLFLKLWEALQEQKQQNIEIFAEQLITVVRQKPPGDSSFQFWRYLYLLREYAIWRAEKKLDPKAWSQALEYHTLLLERTPTEPLVTDQHEKIKNKIEELQRKEAEKKQICQASIQPWQTIHWLFNSILVIGAGYLTANRTYSLHRFSIILNQITAYFIQKRFVLSSYQRLLSDSEFILDLTNESDPLTLTNMMPTQISTDSFITLFASTLKQLGETHTSGKKITIKPDKKKLAENSGQNLADQIIVTLKEKLTAEPELYRISLSRKLESFYKLVQNNSIYPKIAGLVDQGSNLQQIKSRLSTLLYKTWELSNSKRENIRKEILSLIEQITKTQQEITHIRLNIDRFDQKYKFYKENLNKFRKEREVKKLLSLYQTMVTNIDESQKKLNELSQSTTVDFDPFISKVQELENKEQSLQVQLTEQLASFEEPQQSNNHDGLLPDPHNSQSLSSSFVNNPSDISMGAAIYTGQPSPLAILFHEAPPLQPPPAPIPEPPTPSTASDAPENSTKTDNTALEKRPEIVVVSYSATTWLAPADRDKLKKDHNFLMMLRAGETISKALKSNSLSTLFQNDETITIQQDCATSAQNITSIFTIAYLILNIIKLITALYQLTSSYPGLRRWIEHDSNKDLPQHIMRGLFFIEEDIQNHLEKIVNFWIRASQQLMAAIYIPFKNFEETNDFISKKCVNLNALLISSVRTEKIIGQPTRLHTIIMIAKMLKALGSSYPNLTEHHRDIAYNTLFYLYALLNEHLNQILFEITLNKELHRINTQFKNNSLNTLLFKTDGLIDLPAELAPRHLVACAAEIDSLINPCSQLQQTFQTVIYCYEQIYQILAVSRYPDDLIHLECQYVIDSQDKTLPLLNANQLYNAILHASLLNFIPQMLVAVRQLIQSQLYYKNAPTNQVSNLHLIDQICSNSTAALPATEDNIRDIVSACDQLLQALKPLFAKIYSGTRDTQKNKIAGLEQLALALTKTNQKQPGTDKARLNTIATLAKISYLLSQVAEVILFSPLLQSAATYFCKALGKYIGGLTGEQKQALYQKLESTDVLLMSNDHSNPITTFEKFNEFPSNEEEALKYAQSARALIEPCQQLIKELKEPNAKNLSVRRIDTHILSL